MTIEAAERVSEAAREQRLRIAVAESLTGGSSSAALAASTDAQSWFAGGIVAYQTATKHRLLGVAEDVDPCSAECAEQLASGVRRLLASDVAVAITGVGGPDADDGHAPGTVYIAVADASGLRSWHRQFDGDPPSVVEQSVDVALECLLTRLDGDRAQPVGAQHAP